MSMSMSIARLGTMDDDANEDVDAGDARMID